MNIPSEQLLGMTKPAYILTHSAANNISPAEIMILVLYLYMAKGLWRYVLFFVLE